MDEVEQRFIVKYFFVKGWDNERITVELQSALHSSAVPNSTLKSWIKKFKSGDLSCDDGAGRYSGPHESTHWNIDTGSAEAP
jgi:hypothetical protein